MADVKTKKKGAGLAVAAIVIVLLLFLIGTGTFVVRQNEYGVILQFGAVVDVKEDGGNG